MDYVNQRNINIPGKYSKEKFKSEEQFQQIWNKRKVINDYLIEKIKTPLYILITINLLMLCLGFLLDIEIIVIIISIIINTVIFAGLFLTINEVSDINVKGRGLKEITPLKNDIFFFDSPNQDIIYIRNLKKKQVLGMFSIKVMGVPTSIKNNPAPLLRTLYAKGIIYTYQFYYKPKLYKKTSTNMDDDPEKTAKLLLNRMEGKNKEFGFFKRSNMDSEISRNEKHAPDYEMDVIFNFYYKEKVFLDLNKNLDDIFFILKQYRDLVNDLFSQNYSHYRLKMLNGQELISAIQLRFSKKVSSCLSDEIEMGFKNDIEICEDMKRQVQFLSFSSILRMIYFSFLGILLNIILQKILGQNEYYYLLFMGINLCLVTVILIFPISDICTTIALLSKKKHHRLFFDPFEGISFYKHSKAQGILYMFFWDLEIMMGVKYFYLQNLPAYFNFNPDKFYRVLTSQNKKTPFGYTIVNTPYTAQSFIDEQSLYLMKKHQEQLSRSKAMKYKWIEMKGGIFKSIHLFETYSIFKTEEPSEESIIALYQKIRSQTSRLNAIITTGIKGASLKKIDEYKTTLNSFILNTVKTGLYFKMGTEMPQIPMITQNLAEFLKLSGEIKKGIKAQVPAEFIIPTGLESGINFAHIFNTEVSKKESKTGLLVEQLYEGLLVSGDNGILMNLWILGILTNSIKRNIPFIIMDFDGSLSSLLGIFKKTDKNEKILVFKFGKNYAMNLFSSENKDKTDESYYVLKISECFKAAYNLNDTDSSIIQKMVMLKRDLQEYESLTVDLVYNELGGLGDKYSKDSISRVETIFQGIQFDKNLGIFKDLQKGIAPFSEIMFGNKTIVFDLSQLKTQEKILVQLVLIAKMSHFLRENNDYNKNHSRKIIVATEPTQFINRLGSTSNNPFKIFKELINPLIRSDYGLILKTNNPAKLSGFGLSSICPNFLGLKTTDYHDRLFMSQVLQLDDYHSNKRKSSYQKQFLEKMANVLGILKRSDLDFPFPIELDLKQLLNLKRLDEFELIEHMSRLGYDYTKAQESIIENSFETKIDKDFRKFSRLIHDIVGFMEVIRDLPSISGISEKKIGGFLKDRIDDPSDLIGMRKKRKEIITICINHNYFEVDFDSGFEGSSNSKKLFKISKKGIAAIKEFREGMPQKNVRSVVKHIDENGEEIDETTDDVNEGEELKGYENQSKYEEEDSEGENNAFDYNDELESDEILEEFRSIFELGRD